MASSSSAAGPSTGGTGRRSLATNRFDGGVRVWYKEDRILVGKTLMDDDLEGSALDSMSQGRSWKGKGRGFPGEVCCFGEGGSPYRIIAIEVGTGFLFTDVIVICAWAVSDHDTYVDWLARQRSNGFSQLNTAITECQADWQRNDEAVLINGGRESKPMRNTTPEPIVQRFNTERRPSRWRAGSVRAAEAPARIEVPVPTADEQSTGSSTERDRFNWFQRHGSSIVRRFRSTRSSNTITDSRLWRALGRDSPPLNPSDPNYSRSRSWRRRRG